MTQVGLVESLLKSGGFEVQVNGEIVTRVFGGITSAFDGASILVPQAQVSEAMDLLRSAGYVPEEETSSVDAVVLGQRGKKPLPLNKFIWVVLGIIAIILLALSVSTSLLMTR